MDGVVSTSLWLPPSPSASGLPPSGCTGWRLPSPTPSAQVWPSATPPSLTHWQGLAILSSKVHVYKGQGISYTVCIHDNS